MVNFTKALEFGILMSPFYQWLDAAGPIDYLNNHSFDFLQSISAGSTPLPAGLLEKAPVINWHWISTAGDLEPVTATAGPIQAPTTTFKESPQLDYLLVPGPDPLLKLSDECNSWIKAQFGGLKNLLTVCTGSLLITQTGLLDGVEAATNKVALKSIVGQGKFEQFSKVKWVKDKRFAKDGKIWSSAGITAGLDLAAEFVRAFIDPEIVQLGKEIAEYESNPARPDPFAYILEGVVLK
ncbi:ThiJ/PfpI [Coprinellus micaceus]|uniref:ThiJ/PfpI n=1 Tax=Coprinellus micaceus TaxID=71717 RepID=A0A4Y7TK53_COPMI|nr:ThiJ/PfpI [Coprinellus micaceus]